MKNKFILSACFFSLFIFSFNIIKSNNVEKEVISMNLNEETKNEFEEVLQNLFDTRNEAILKKYDTILKKLYEIDKNPGLWAYEHEVNKMKYLENWSSKQGVNFTNIDTKIKMRSVNEKEENLYEIICATSTKYSYCYEGQEDTINYSKIGTNHYLNIKKVDDSYVIVKEWYEDPFADSLNLENIKSEDIKSFILSQEKKEINLTDEQQKAIEYAHRYCGVSDEEEYEFKFNKDYKNFNPDGGDCANFASQIMFESGRFKKNSIWNYEDRNGTKAWVNAQGFKNYILNSQRGSLIAKGSYNEVYKQAYNLKPGDFVAYEKNGRITHVSTITGSDSKGYPLVTCHNTDRLLVPWDLGWSDNSIKFHLISVHY